MKRTLLAALALALAPAAPLLAQDAPPAPRGPARPGDMAPPDAFGEGLGPRGAPRMPPPGPGMHRPPGGPGHAPPPPDAPPPMRKMPPDWVPDEELLADVRADDPDLWRDLESEGLEHFRSRNRLWHWKQNRERLEKLREVNPRQAERLEKVEALERRAFRLAQDARQQQEAGARPSTTELEGVLAELFDLREADRRDEMSRLEKRLAELKAGLDDRRARKGEIVQRRLKEMLGEEDPLGW